jgi:transposase
MQPSPCFIGIDVSKAYLDVASRPEGLAFRLPNTAEGIASLVERIRASSPALVLLEATGGLERPAAVALSGAKIPVRIVEPGRVRHFAKSIGQHAKTDRLDARLLAQYAEAAKPESRELPDEETRNLQALLERRRQLVAMRVAEENRLQQATSAAVAANLNAVIAFIKEQIHQIDRSVGEAIEAKQEWKLRADLLKSVPGVGPQTARVLLGSLPELGSMNGKKIAALAGLAPYPDDSGDIRKPRRISGGRSAVRTALYMASLSAMRYNSELKTFYRRLCLAGKAPKQAITAVSRKLLTILNAMIRDMAPWQPKKTSQET